LRPHRHFLAPLHWKAFPSLHSLPLVLLEGVVKLFRYLDEGLAIILVFIGIKMLLSEVYHIAVGFSCCLS
jgi:hypothetical protein